jgi:signal transduction histidine kinase
MDSSLADLRSAPVDTTLLGAVRRRAHTLEAATGVRIEVRGDAGVTGLAASHVFYVVSEAMTNAVRHASPSQVIVTLHIENGALFASVEDDGTGLPAETTWDSQGIRSMVERAELLGGRLEMPEPSVGRGTRLRLVAPLRMLLEVIA